MVDLVNVFLPMMLYICGIILLIILIILSIKFIGILNKVERVVDNVEEKVNSFNTFFSLMDKASDSIIGIGNTVVNAVNSLVSKIVKKNKIYEEEEIIDE